MILDFQLVTEVPEDAFLESREALPREEVLALEIATKRKLDPDDVKVEYSLKDGQRYVAYYARVLRVIDCSKNVSWIADVEERLRAKQPFDLFNATKADIAQLDPVVRPYADWFRSSDVSEPTPRRRFRLVSAPTNSVL